MLLAASCAAIVAFSAAPRASPVAVARHGAPVASLGVGRREMAIGSAAALATVLTASDCLAAEGFDGAMLDMEGIGRGIGPPKDYDAITYAVCKLKAEINRTIPGNVMMWTTDVRKQDPNLCLHGR